MNWSWATLARAPALSVTYLFAGLKSYFVVVAALIWSMLMLMKFAVACSVKCSCMYQK